MAKADEQPRFSVHPTVVLQLGESLISDAVQALIELVKNAYDADATFARVVIDTAGVTKVDGMAQDFSGGIIVVEDDGSGMRKDDIFNGWLLISNRAKRTLKEAKKTTEGGRTPLGDKGLGRLGVQKLGDRLDVFTQAKGGPAYHFGFSWLDFATAPSLADVNIEFEKTTFDRATGTKIVVTSLREADLWRGEDAIKRLQRELSRMISPFRAIRDFIVAIEADGKAIDLEDISDKVRDLAPVRYSITFDGKKLSFVGRARLDFFRPPNAKDAEEFALIAESDDGDRFFEYLKSQKKAAYLNLRRSAGKRWFVEFRRERQISDLDRLEPDLTAADGTPANPGPFSGEVDSFDFSPSSFNAQNVFDRITEFRQQIQRLSGVRVYRDGFAVRVDDDWLNFGKGWTSAGSYYGLKPGNTVGYIALSARENMQLEETTDREGFKDTPPYRNFYSMMMEFKKFTAEAHEFFGRSWSDFCKARREQLSRVDTRKEIEDISRDIKTAVTGAPDQEAAVMQFSARLAASLERSQAVVGKLADAEQVTPRMQAQARETFEALSSLSQESSRVLEQVSTYLHQLQELKGLGQVLEDRVDSLRRQVDDMYQTVALGLTAEAIAHEVFQIADNLARRTKSVQSRADSSSAVENYLDHVQSAVMALRKQVSYLSPALRYVREKREEVSVGAAIREIIGFYTTRLEKNGIDIVVEDASGEAFKVWMNRGKLSQVCDNFILNSEYWLKQDLGAKRIKRGRLTFEIERPFIRVFDNGRGIDPSVESALFEPFISGKLRNEGRGLGLFIVKQLLDSEGCHVGIVPERNASDRLFKFQIDLRGALHE